MNELRYTLISDGSSDKVLLNVIKWLLDDLFPQLPFTGTYGDLRILPHPPRAGEVRNRIERTQEYYPFDFLFYHRDAESIDDKIIPQRIHEIKQEIRDELRDISICVVPVKMMETWLLIDREAIKKVAGNRSYSAPIELPSLQKLEKLQEPKALLHEILRQVSGRKSRNLKNFNVHEAVHLVGEYIEDYSPLRNMKAFLRFESDVKKAVNHFISNHL